MEMERYKMFYENKNNHQSIRILGEEFVKNNKNKGYIIYNNKKYPLQKLLSCQNFKNDKLKIMMLLSKDCYNKSCMFKDCSLLITFECHYNIKRVKDSLCEGENIYFISEFDDKEENNFYDNDKAYNSIKDPFIDIFISEFDDKEEIYDNEKTYKSNIITRYIKLGYK